MGDLKIQLKTTWFFLSGRIEFWLFVFFIIHLWGITWPPLEAAHSWRQTTGLMVARNYFEGNTSFLYPMVDETNGGSGIIGMEFPILYYLQGKLGLIFGFSDGLGRLIHLLISTLGVYFFYKLLKDILDEKMSLLACLLFMISAFFTYSRKVMPDTACLALFFWGAYHWNRSLNTKHLKHILWATLGLSLGLLVKISALPLLGFLCWLYLKREDSKFKARWLIPIVSTLPMICWYFIWNPYLATEFGNWYNVGGQLTDGLSVFWNQRWTLFINLVFHPFFSYLIWFPLIIGTFFAFKNRSLSVILGVSLFFVLFALYALKSGEIFLTHDYYYLPLVPLFSVLAAYGLLKLNHWKYAVLGIVALECLANQQHDFHWNQNEAYQLNLTGLVDKYIAKDALIAINGNGNPRELYFCHRKGWNLFDDQIQTAKTIDNLKVLGCDYLVFVKRNGLKWTAAQIIYENKHYAICKVD